MTGDAAHLLTEKPDAAHLLTEKPGLADRVLVVVKNDGKFLGWRRFGCLLGDRDVIGEFGLATKAAIRRIFLRSPPFGWKRRRLGRSQCRPSVRSR
ncbi:hypothetical protein ACVWZ6_007092 [Bradyrhizobium sp. GM6.1]